MIFRKYYSTDVEINEASEKKKKNSCDFDKIFCSYYIRLLLEIEVDNSLISTTSGTLDYNVQFSQIMAHNF